LNLTVKEICNATMGKLHNVDYGDPIKGVSIDSREIPKNCLFVPIIGENFDGHNFILEAVAKGAICALYEHDFAEMNNLTVPLIKVASCRRALIDLAILMRSQFNGEVIAITGSAGKTTTKDMTASILSKKYETLKTKGNFNNDIGLPLTLLNLQPQNNALVLEMGMNHPGEISLLSNISLPKVCIITNIGDAHIENFGNRSGILKAKAEIFQGIQQEGTAILNGDDPLLAGLSTVANMSNIALTVYAHIKNDSSKISSSKKNVIFAEVINRNGFMGTVCNIHWNIYGIGEGQTEALIPLPGDHMIMNALLAFATGLVLQVDVDSIVDGIKSFQPSGYRMAMSTINGVTIVNDTYNASTLSMKATIDMMNVAEGRKVCIFGDMFELGDYAKNLHSEIGRYASEKIDLMLTVGTLSKHIHDSFIAEGQTNAVHFDTKEDFLQHWEEHIKFGDTVLIKASRGMTLETIVATMIEQLHKSE